VHEPPAGGGSSYRRSSPLDPRLFRAAEALVADLNYTGLVMVEFRVNAETGDWILVEINGRFWGSLPLAVAAGVDFPRYLYEMLVEGRVKFPKSYKNGVYCRNITLDMTWFKKNFKADQYDQTRQVVPLGQVLSEFRNILTLSEHVDTFAVDDPIPFLIEIREIGNRAVLFFLRKAERITGLSAFFKRRRATAALRKISAAKSIAFICYGNICRSPFAEVYARTIAPSHIKFSSAGILGKANRRAPTEALTTAAKFGIDLAEHRSQQISIEQIETADVLVIFDRLNLKEISRRFPQAKTNIVRLGDFLPGSDDEIADPFGQSPACFEDCYGKIISSLSAISRNCWTTKLPTATAESQTVDAITS
jgi:protein-tyrosine-phosphatase